MGLFDGPYALKQPGDFVKTLLPGLLRHGGVHVRPFVIFAVGRVLQIDLGGRHLAAVQQLEPQLGVLLLVGGGFLENLRDLHIAILAGLGRIVGVLIPRLTFSGKGRHQIGFRFGSLQ